MSYILGIDLGTSSVKTLLLDEGGQQVSIAQQNYTFEMPQPLWAEQNPEDWWSATCLTIRKSIEGISASDIKGIGFSGQMHAFLPLDSAGRPIGNCIIWADRRSFKEVDDVYSILGRELISRTAHSPVGTGFLVPTMLWVKRHQRDVYERIAHLVLPKDYIRLKLTGEIGTDISDASATLAFDVDRGCWSDEIITRMGFPRPAFPYVGMPSEIAGYVTHQAAKETGLKEGTPVVFGAADQVMQAIGNGIYSPGKTSVTIGTGGQVLTVLHKPIIDIRLVSHCFNFTSEKLWYFLGASLSGGYSLRWFRDILGNVDSYQQIDEQAAEVPVGSDRLVFLPYLSGERTPYMDSYARGVFFGLSNNHTKANMYRAIMEGVTFSMKDCLDVLLSNIDYDFDYIIASGKSSSSPFWVQMEADVFNKPIIVSSMKEQAATGAAMTAGVGVGLFSSYEEVCLRFASFDSRPIMPIPANVEKYARILEVYRELYQVNSTLMRTISHFN